MVGKSSPLSHSTHRTILQKTRSQPPASERETGLAHGNPVVEPSLPFSSILCLDGEKISEWGQGQMGRHSAEPLQARTCRAPLFRPTPHLSARCPSRALPTIPYLSLLSPSPPPLSPLSSPFSLRKVINKAGLFALELIHTSQKDELVWGHP